MSPKTTPRAERVNTPREAPWDDLASSDDSDDNARSVPGRSPIRDAAGALAVGCGRRGSSRTPVALMEGRF